ERGRARRFGMQDLDERARPARTRLDVRDARPRVKGCALVVRWSRWGQSDQPPSIQRALVLAVEADDLVVAGGLLGEDEGELFRADLDHEEELGAVGVEAAGEAAEGLAVLA